MKYGELEILIDKYLNGTATEAEIKIVDDWYHSFDNNQGFSDNLSQKEIQVFLKSAYSSLEKKLD